MPVARPAQGQKSPSIQGFRSRAALRGRLAGDKASPAPPGTARAAGHRPRGASAAVLRRGVVGLEIDDQNLVGPSPPAGRSGRRPAPACRPVAPAGRRSRPPRGCRAQTPAQTAHRRSAPARLSASASRSASVQSVGIAGEIAPARPRGGARLAMSGSDCSSRCTSVPRCSARARSAIGFARSYPMAVIVGRVGRAQQIVGRGVSGGAGVRSHDGSMTGAMRYRRNRTGRRCGIFRPRIAFHLASRRVSTPAAAIRSWRGPWSIRSYQRASRTVFLLPGMQPPTISRSAARVIAT